MVKLLAPLAVLVLLACAILLADRPHPRADFVFINEGDITTLDLSRMSWMQDLRTARLLYEGLTRQDVFSPDYAPLPGVAERWDLSDDRRVYTFHLRRNARWSNGEPVLASHFIFAWRRALLPDSGGDYAGLVQLIRGGEDFYRWRTAAIAGFAARHAGAPDRAAAEALWRDTTERFARTVGLSAPDDRTLRVELERPTPYFLDLTSFVTFFPLYEPLVAAHETINPRTGQVETSPDWTRPDRLVSNGPFRLERWDFKREMRLEHNPHWWDAPRLNIRSVSMPAIEEPSAQVLAFTTGAVDFVTDVTAPYRGGIIARKDAYYREHAPLVESLRAAGLDPVEIDRRLPPDPRQNIHVLPAFGTYFYNFNCSPALPDGRRNPFADARIRRAFAMAIDREAIVRNIRRTGEPAAAVLIPPGSIGGYASPAGLACDPAAARALLAEAGHPGGAGLPVIDILFNKDNGHDLIAQAVAKDWEANLGVAVSLTMKEVKAFREDLKNANFMTARASWFGDYGDPTTFLDINRTGDGNNDRRYSNPAYDALLDAARDQPDPAARLAILSRAEAMVVEQELPLAPIFHYSQIYLFDPHRVAGISPHPRQVQNLYLVDILGDGRGSETAPAMPPVAPTAAGGEP